MKLPTLPALLLPLALTACASTSSAPSAPAPPARGTEPMTNDDVLVLYSGGCERWMDDPRDAALREALELVDERLLELLEETEADAPMELLRVALPLAKDVLSAPMNLRVDFDPEGDWAAGPPVDVQLRVQGEEDEVTSISKRVLGLLGSAEVELEPVAGDPALKTLATPAGSVFIGRSQADFVVSYGEPSVEPMGLGSLDLPAGAEPVVALKLDMAKLRGPLEMLLGLAGEEAAPIKMQLEMMGLLADEPISITSAIGRADGRSYIASRYGNYVAAMEAQGGVPAGPIPASDLALVPADATFASVSVWQPKAIGVAIDRIAQLPELEGNDPFAMVAAMTGVDLRSELLDTLGATAGMYTSVETGGGGAGSLVTFFAVEDPETLSNTIFRVSDLLEGLAHDATEGRVGVREWKHGDALCWSMEFPGFPIPLEWSLALTDSHLFATLTPQALVAALDRAAAPGADLRSVPLVRAWAGDAEDAWAVSYVDTPFWAGRGYTFASMLFSAVGNAVRKPGHDRGPHLILPAYSELIDATVPQVLVSRLEGNDLVSLGESDPSVVAGVTALLGSPLPLIFGAAAASGALAGVQAEQAQAAQAELEMLQAPPGPPQDGMQEHAEDHEHEGDDTHSEHEGDEVLHEEVVEEVDEPENG